MTHAASALIAKHKASERPLIVDDIYDAQGGLCFHCLKHMDPWPWTKRHPNGFTREHVAPKAHGGSMWRNIVLAHQCCNLKRATNQLSRVDLARARLIIAAVVVKRGGWV